MNKGTEIVLKVHVMVSVIESQGIWMKAAINDIGKKFGSKSWRVLYDMEIILNFFCR